MKVRIEYLKDTIGNNYIGVNIYYDLVYQYLNALKDILGDEYDVYTNNQYNRDHGKHHITVINVADYNRVLKEIGVDKFINSFDKYFKMEFDISLMGIGKAEKNENIAYFVVVKSDDLQELRKIYGLPEQDFHITLGFKWKDVFGVRKDKILTIQDPFIKLLSNEYYKNDSFNFVKSLVNYDGEDGDLNPIEIDLTRAVLKVGKNKFYQISLVNNQIYITGKWEDNKNEKPIIPNTIIYRKLKK